MRTALASIAVAVAVLAPVDPPRAGAEAHPRPVVAARSCGGVTFSGMRLQIVTLRGVTCVRAKQVARYYDRHFRGPEPWRCFLARQGDPEKIACGSGSRGGDIRRAPHAFVGR